MDNHHILVAAVQYKLTTDRGLQVREHTHILSDVTEQLTKNRKDEVAISAQYQAYKQPFFDML